jgi:uncharacterized protein YwbE
MKYWILTGFVMSACLCNAQSIVGTWQLTAEKTCFESNMQISETEKELLPQMGSTSATTVARTIRFDQKGTGEEGIFSVGKKKASGKSTFRYKINGQELLLLDSKSGMMTRGLVIDTLTQSTLKFHTTAKECERKTFIRIK